MDTDQQHEEDNEDYWRENLHPESILQTESQVTLQDLKSSFYAEGSQLQQALKRYSLQQRRHLIVDRSSGEIIDSRNQEVVQGMFKKAFKKHPQRSQNYEIGITQQKSIVCDNNNVDNNNSPKTNNSNSNSPGIKHNPWQQHWQASDKLHQRLLSSICNNDLSTFTTLLSRKQNSLPININYKSFDNWSPIHYASMHGHVEILKLLIKQKDLKLNTKTNFGWNALHVAVNSNKKEICQILVENGAQINQQDQDLNTPLHYAVQLGYQDIIKILVKAAPNVTLVNHKGLTAKNLCTNKNTLNLFPKQSHLSNQEEDGGLFSSIFKNRKIQYIQKLLGVNQAPVQVNSTFDQNQILSPNKKSKSDQNEETNNKIKGRKSNIVKMYKLLKQNKLQQPVSLSSFKFFKKIGEGAFGQVYVVKKGNKEKLYALKAIKKEKVLKTNLYRYIQTQKEVLSLIRHPFIVRLNYAFQTETYLFLVMDYCEGGDLGKLLQRKKKLQQSTTKAYACQIILAIEALHKNLIIYRDLKPENIVIDKDGHALLTDFGLSKKTKTLDDINKSFCGTPAYLPLQIIEKRGHTRMVDWYQFGIVLYEMMVGIPPFYADNRIQLYQNVKNGVIKFPKSIPQKFRDLIKGLLHQDYTKRLGFQQDAQSIKQHPWFNDIDWDEVCERKLKVPPVQKKLQIGTQPVRCKFQDTKSEKYQVPSWSFVQPS